jgi:hypothetical protein
MKKLLIVPLVFAFAFALTASVAFGFESYSFWDNDDSGLKVENDNWASVDNYVFGVSNTGVNDANDNEDLGVIITGNAGAAALSETYANQNEVDIEDCDCIPRRGEVKIENENGAHVDNLVVALANTGLNDANNNGSTNFTFPWLYSSENNTDGNHGSLGAGIIVTGDAGSVASAFTLVNTNIVELGED